MECPCCGKYYPPDKETGYDVDEPCPFCKIEDKACVEMLDGWEEEDEEC